MSLQEEDDSMRSIVEPVESLLDQPIENASQIKIPPLPEYNGERSAVALDRWILKVERHKQIFQWTDIQTYMIATLTLTDSAEVWLLNYETTLRMNNHIGSWTNLKHDLIQQFKPALSIQTARDKLANIKQDRSVAEYIDEFTKICLEIPNITEDEKKDKFIRGLKPRIYEHVATHNPPDLEQAKYLALLKDSAMGSINTRLSFNNGSAFNHNNGHNSSIVPMDLDNINQTKRNNFRRNNNKNFNDKKYSCYYCGKLGHLKQNCKTRQHDIWRLVDSKKNKDKVYMINRSDCNDKNINDHSDSYEEHDVSEDDDVLYGILNKDEFKQ